MIKHKLIDHLPITGDMVSLWLPSGQNRAMDIIRGNHGQCDGTHPNVPVLPNVINPSLGWHFDGDDDYIDLGNDSSLDMGVGDFGISIWTKTSSVGWMRLVDIRDASNGYTLNVDANNKITLELNDGTGNTGFQSDTVINDGVWHHIVISANRDGDVDFYLDGSPDGSRDISAKSGSLTSTNNLYLGVDTPAHNSFLFTGYIVLPFIAKSAWSVAQVNNFYLATRGLFSPRG